jgi:hypothetical protein
VFSLSWPDVAAGPPATSLRSCLLTSIPDDAAGVFPDVLLSF